MPQFNFCSVSFFKINALIMHLKIIHRCENNSIFVCGEPNSNRNFPALNSYRKHLKAHEPKTHLDISPYLELSTPTSTSHVDYLESDSLSVSKQFDVSPFNGKKGVCG